MCGVPNNALIEVDNDLSRQDMTWFHKLFDIILLLPNYN